MNIYKRKVYLFSEFTYKNYVKWEQSVEFTYKNYVKWKQLVEFTCIYCVKSQHHQTRIYLQIFC